MHTISKSLAGLGLAAALSSTPAFADHNSRWGEGWANMPNDIHNTRIETRGEDTTFRDFVRHGNGADSDNRFATTEARGRMSVRQTGQRSARTAQKGKRGGRR